MEQHGLQSLWEVKQDPNNPYTIYLPGGKLPTDSQVIESTDDEETLNDTSSQAALAEEDCRLYLCPSQQSLPLEGDNTMEAEDHAHLEEPAEADGTTGAVGEDTGNSETSPTSLPIDGESVNCHAPACASCRSDLGTLNMPELKIDICQKYALGTCRYGIDGSKCKFSHPSACKKLLRHGQWGVNGCAAGEECQLFHPVCRESLTQNFCSRGARCHYQHPTSWRRIVGDVSQLKK